MARLLGHYPGLTLADLRGLRLRDFNALVDAAHEDAASTRRAPEPPGLIEDMGGGRSRTRLT